MNLKNEIPAILAGNGLPRYEEITSQQVKDHFPSLLKKLSEELNIFEKDLEKNLNEDKNLSWDEVMKPLQQIGEKLRWSWGVVSHLNAVCNSTELRQAYATHQPEIVRFTNRMGQSQVIHQALQKLKKQDSQRLNSTQQRILEKELLITANKVIISKRSVSK